MSGGFATRLIHVGSQPDSHTGAVIPPLSLASTFAQRSPGVPFPGNFEYSRSGNPSRENFEQALASAEGGRHCAAFSSGSAVLQCVVHLLKPGEQIVTGEDIYGGTSRYFRTIAIQNGIGVAFVDTTNLETFRASLRALSTNARLIWLESPTNPLLKVSDIAAICIIAKEVCGPGVIVALDNTLMSPYCQRPLELGVDIVSHSVSKYINGHSDVILGALIVNDEAIFARIKYLRNAIGSVPSPFDCHMAHRGLKTLHVRMERCVSNAMQIALWLEQHAHQVERISYPGLHSHPQHDIAKRQQHAFGAMITVWLRGDLQSSKRFLESVRLFTLAESLGDIESLIEHPAIMTHASIPSEQRRAIGISDTMVRLSIGLEDVEDLIADLRHALNAMKI